MLFWSASGQKYRNGTCLTAAECLEQSGSSSGSCAGGYGLKMFLIKKNDKSFHKLNFSDLEFAVFSWYPPVEKQLVKIVLT